MNKHILLVMKWLNDKDSVTQEALNDNRTAIGYATVGYLTNSIMIPFMLLWIHLGRAICKKGYNNE